MLYTVPGDEYKEKVALEETYEKLNSIWLQKKKTLENMENEIRVSLMNIILYSYCMLMSIIYLDNNEND